MVPTQYYGESGVWKGTPVALKNGRNYITVQKIGSLSDTRGGMLYLTYAGSNPEEIKLQVRVLSNAWEMPVLELSDWYSMGQSARKDVIRTYVQELEAYVSGLTGANYKTDVRNATEISTPSVLLSLPADQVLAGLKGVDSDESAMVEAMYQNVLAWEEELFVANQVQGIIDSSTALSGYQYPMTTRQNIRYMRMFAGAFMYAAGNHIGVEYGSTSALVQDKPTSVTGAGSANGLFGWGIAHEIGHNMDKLGKAEITNNIYSLALQAWDGGSMSLNTRLTEDGRWADLFNKVAQGRPGTANNVFVQLGMYWQLHLAYDNASQPLAFYNQFFKLWKSGAYSGYTTDERVALIASQVADRNLTEFFTRWGVTLSDGVKDMLDDYQPETRAIWYLNDASRTYRLGSGSAANGSATVTASVEESQVTLTIQHTDASKILGYEIRRNGVAIAFTTGSTYTDNLGAANNRTSTGGKVTASAARAEQGEVITLNAAPNAGFELSSLTVTTSAGKKLSLADKGNGKYTFTMPAAAVAVTALFAPQETQPDFPFDDVAQGTWYYEGVRYAYEHGLMSGTGEGTFSPDLPTSRGMLVTILYRMAGSPAAGSASFTDVAPGQWYADGVAWASANGVVSGYTDGRFRPNDTITREQMAAILYQYARLQGKLDSGRADLSIFADVDDLSAYAKEPMSWAVAQGLFSGVSADMLAPGGSTTRAQAAVILTAFSKALG